MTDAIEAAIWNDFHTAEQKANATPAGADHAAIYKNLAASYGVSIQAVHAIIRARTTDVMGAG